MSDLLEDDCRGKPASFIEGYMKGVRAFAWWEDGEQWCGTCGTSLKEALTILTKLLEKRKAESLWVRHCVAREKMYDDYGHCDTKMTRFQDYFTHDTVDGQQETFCPGCAAVAMLQEFGGEDYYTEESAQLKASLGR